MSVSSIIPVLALAADSPRVFYEPTDEAHVLRRLLCHKPVAVPMESLWRPHRCHRGPYCLLPPDLFQFIGKSLEPTKKAFGSNDGVTLSDSCCHFRMAAGVSRHGKDMSDHRILYNCSVL